MLDGKVYELQTPAHLTNDSEFLFSPVDVFNTITTVNSVRSERFRGKANPTPAEFVAEMELLRTPTAAEVEGGPVHPDVAKAKGQTLRLTGQMLALLPTPNTQEGSGKCRDYRADLTHAITCNCHEWGKFAPAIERWESITKRSSPSPALPDGQKGQHRLSSKFTEWLMGLPDGWITNHGLNRKDEIKMAGNGVVPQQAELALKILLGVNDE
jgi:hypothetical protein